MKSVNKIFTRNFLAKHYGLILSLFVAFISSFLYSALSVLRHIHFQSGAFDLGIFDQSLWQYAHFLSPYSTIKEKFILGDHLNLTMPLLAPLYWIWDDVRGLLIFQAVWVSFSTVGISLYLKKRTFTQLQSLLLSFTYLFFYGIQFGIFFDFHPILIAVGLLAWLLYFWEAEQGKLFWTTLILLFLTQENTGVALVGLCCIWFFEGKRKKLVIMLAGLGIIATAISFFAIHLLSQGHLQYVPHFAKTIPGIIQNFYDAPEKRQVWWYSFVSFGFLPLFSPGALLAVIGDLSQYFITGDAFNHMWSPFLHHRAILAVFLIAGTADVLLFLKTKKIPVTLLVIVLVIWSLFITYHYHFAITKLFHKEYWQDEPWMKDNYAIMQSIPPQASLATQQSLVPHVDHREQIYLIYPRQHNLQNFPGCNKNCWWLDFSGNPGYVFVDTHDNEWETMTLESIDNFRSALENMERVGVLTVVKKQGEARLFAFHPQKLKRVGL